MIAVGALTSWVVLRAGSYSELLTVENGDFAAEVEEISYDQIPMVDKESAQRLATRKLGELADMVSQFEIREDYTQINYQGRPVRVASLVYADLVKWFTNRSEGPASLSDCGHGDSGRGGGAAGGGNEVYPCGALRPEPLPAPPLPLSHLYVRRAGL